MQLRQSAVGDLFHGGEMFSLLHSPSLALDDIVMLSWKVKYRIYNYEN